MMKGVLKLSKISFRGKCARTGHPLKLLSPTKLARLGHFPPATHAGRLAGPVFYTITFSGSSIQYKPILDATMYIKFSLAEFVINRIDYTRIVFSIIQMSVQLRVCKLGPPVMAGGHVYYREPEYDVTEDYHTNISHTSVVPTWKQGIYNKYII
jgi:hypothetical protein